jgi:hypothetical protein
MFTRINVYQFRDEFTLANRKDQFSYEGLGILFDYLEQVEDDTGEPIELDVIALCCDYSEDTFVNVAKNYGIGIDECENEDEIKETVLDYLNCHTAVCGHDDDIVVFACF